MDHAFCISRKKLWRNNNPYCGSFDTVWLVFNKLLFWTEVFHHEWNNSSNTTHQLLYLLLSTLVLFSDGRSKLPKYGKLRPGLKGSGGWDFQPHLFPLLSFKLIIIQQCLFFLTRQFLNCKIFESCVTFTSNVRCDAISELHFIALEDLKSSWNGFANWSKFYGGKMLSIVAMHDII